MSLSKLTIFSKDTDANEVLKGYEYQKLRTLENWLSNKVHKVDEVIYCEYEDDIFQRNIEAGTSKYTQIKLYGSKSFSFKSEEITKSIANFFMLFVKGEYSFDTVQFIFETNTAIARKYGDNDAVLLQDWVDNQVNLDAVLLQKCTTKVKSILIDYIKDEFPKVDKDRKSEAFSAMKDFDDLPLSVWEDFAKSIRWIFNAEAPDSAIETVINSIKEFIAVLPFPSLENKIDTIFTTLYYEVSVKMFQNVAENRCLTSKKIDSLILELGDESDKQYNIAYEAWKQTKEIKYFILAEFLEVLHSAKHCRRSDYLKEHSQFWLNLLYQFIQFAKTPSRYRQKAIYEFLWLSLRPKWLNKPEGTLIGLNDLIEQYFSKLSKFDDHESFENNLNMIQVVQASIKMDKCDLEAEKVDYWSDEIGSIIFEKNKSIENPSEKCYWLELQAGILSNPLNFAGEESEYEELSQTYTTLIELLPQAPLYNVSRLNDRINQFIKLYIQAGNRDEFVDFLEILADKLMPFVSEKHGKYELAKAYIGRGAKYLHTTNPNHLAKALNYFHKAKDLWFQDETHDGYLLALFNISQLYSALGMNLAAKYYALSAVWFSINNNPEKSVRRIVNAFGLLFYCDYKQGSWISALDSFKYYIITRSDFDKKPIDESDVLLMKSFIEVASILTLAPKISIQLISFIEFQKQNMGEIYSEFIQDMVVEYETLIKEIGIKTHIQNKLDSSPINDIGPTRILEWKACGSVWAVSFSNTWLLNSLGEEFVAVLQILLVELSSSSIDLHFIRTNVEIEILESDELKSPEQLPSNHSFKWKVFVKQIDVPDNDKMRFNMGSLIVSMQYLLRDVSMIEDDRFFEKVNSLFQNEALAEKTMTNNLYQRIYRRLFTEESFNDSKRNLFSNESFRIEPHEAKVLEWNDKQSPLYSREESHKRIKGRYIDSNKVIHLTIDHLKKQPGYNEWLNNLRKQNWLDWQILLAVYNQILSYKANFLVSRRTYASEEEKVLDLKKSIFEIRKMDEKETYVEFPLIYFTDAEFEFQLDQTAYIVLQTWGLENKASFPNFPAIRDFLNYRFNFGIDDIPELSPL